MIVFKIIQTIVAIILILISLYLFIGIHNNKIKTKRIIFSSLKLSYSYIIAYFILYLVQ
jgi:hypothetical protein